MEDDIDDTLDASGQSARPNAPVGEDARALRIRSFIIGRSGLNSLAMLRRDRCCFISGPPMWASGVKASTKEPCVLCRAAREKRCQHCTVLYSNYCITRMLQ